MPRIVSFHYTLRDPGGRALGDLAQLALAAAPVVLDVHEDAGPGAEPLREHQVDDVLEGREPLALPADQGAERLLLVALAGDVDPAGVARLDLDRDVEAEVLHQDVEDLLRGSERLR